MLSGKMLARPSEADCAPLSGDHLQTETIGDLTVNVFTLCSALLVDVRPRPENMSVTLDLDECTPKDTLGQESGDNKELRTSIHQPFCVYRNLSFSTKE